MYTYIRISGRFTFSPILARVLFETALLQSLLDLLKKVHLILVLKKLAYMKNKFIFEYLLRVYALQREQRRSLP